MLKTIFSKTFEEGFRLLSHWYGLGNWYRSTNINNSIVRQKCICGGNIITWTKNEIYNIKFTSRLFNLLGEEK